jgi:hypothetical protein
VDEVTEILAAILDELRSIRAALESQGIAVKAGITESQNDAAFKEAIERAVDGDKMALTRFITAGGRVPKGKSFWPQAQSRTSRPSGSKNRKDRVAG